MVKSVGTINNCPLSQFNVGLLRLLREKKKKKRRGRNIEWGLAGDVQLHMNFDHHDHSAQCGLTSFDQDTLLGAVQLLLLLLLLLHCHKT